MGRLGFIVGPKTRLDRPDLTGLQDARAGKKQAICTLPPTLTRGGVEDRPVERELLNGFYLAE